MTTTAVTTTSGNQKKKSLVAASGAANTFLGIGHMFKLLLVPIEVINDVTKTFDNSIKGIKNPFKIPLSMKIFFLIGFLIILLFFYGNFIFFKNIISNILNKNK